MKPPGRLKGEYRSAQREGAPVKAAAPGRPEAGCAAAGARIEAKWGLS